MENRCVRGKQKTQVDRDVNIPTSRFVMYKLLMGSVVGSCRLKRLTVSQSATDRTDRGLRSRLFPARNSVRQQHPNNVVLAVGF